MKSEPVLEAKDKVFETNSLPEVQKTNLNSAITQMHEQGFVKQIWSIFFSRN